MYDCGVYQIRNNITGDLYIGQSKQLTDRLPCHLYSLRKGKHHSIVLQRAYNKYGEFSFQFSILVFCEEQELDYYEQKLVDILNPLYNIRKECVVSNRGLVRSPETRLLISLAAKNVSTETRQRMSLSHVGKTFKHSIETREKIRLSNLGQKRSEETRELLSLTHKGKKLSKESIEKRTETRRKNGWNKRDK